VFKQVSRHVGPAARRILLATAALLPAAAARAADLPLKAPPPLVMESWAGPYIGAYFAAVGGNFHESAAGIETDVINTDAARANLAGKNTGTMASLFTGRNWQFGRFVVGGQIEATVASDVALHGEGPGTLVAGPTNAPTFAFSTTTNNDPQLKFMTGAIGRAGFLLRPELLLYGLGGFEFGHFSYPDFDQFLLRGVRLHDHGWSIGYTAGVGAEGRLDDHWSWRAEYRYLHFDPARSLFLDLGAPTILSTTHRDQVDMQVATIGLAYRFGETGPMAAMAAIPPASRKIWADSWAGPYAGIYFGAGAGHAAESFNSSSGDGSFMESSPGTGKMTGSMTDLFLGYNWRSGRIVAGAQAEGTLFSDVGFRIAGPRTTVDTIFIGGVFNSQFIDIGPSFNDQQLRSTVGLIGRAGLLATPNLLLYGLGGLELGHFVFPNALGDGTLGKWVAGYTAGAGGELKIDDHWSLRSEYRYMHFGVSRDTSVTFTQFDPVSGAILGSGTTNSTRRTATDFHVGKIGVAYKFGEPGPVSAMAAIPPLSKPAWSDGWAGPYFGAYVGAGAGRARSSFTQRDISAGDTQTTTAALSGNTTGMQTDLFAGYNFRRDRLVFGGQVEVTQFSDVAAKTTGVGTFVDPFSSRSDTVDHGDQLRSMVGVIGRAGVLATPDLLLYGLAGPALGHFTFPDTGAEFRNQNGKWVLGYTAGAGAELRVASHWSLRAEYRYLHFGIGRAEDNNFLSESIDAAGNVSISTSSSSVSQHSNVDFHSGKIGLVYRMGEDPSSAMAAMAGGAPCCDRWTGFNAGIYGAAGKGRVRDTVTGADNFADFDQTGAFVFGQTDTFSGNALGNVTGGMVDLFAGYNWRNGRFVVGGQAEASIFGDIKLRSVGMESGSFTTLPSPPGTTASFSGSFMVQQSLQSRAGLIGRAGFLATPDLLLYGLAGAEFGHFALSSIDDFGGENGKWVLGYTAGAGAELKLTDRWSLRGEYRFMRFDVSRNHTFVNNTSQVGFGPTFQTDTTDTRTRMDFHLAKLGLAYAFCYCQ
jgi:opacity protein-like surface antigen